MYRISRQKAGFTIVELLIVIVVIAILAAITIVGFNGVQARAHDSAVQADLNAMQKKVQLAMTGGDAPTTAAQVSSLLKPSQSYGSHDQFPLIALKTQTNNTFDGFSFYALSRSGKVFSAAGGSINRAASADSIDDIIAALEGELAHYRQYLTEAQAINDTEEVAWTEEMIALTESRLAKANATKQSGGDLWGMEGREQDGSVIGTTVPLQVMTDGLFIRKDPTSPNCTEDSLEGYSYDSSQGRWLPMVISLGTSCAI